MADKITVCKRTRGKEVSGPEDTSQWCQNRRTWSTMMPEPWIVEETLTLPATNCSTSFRSYRTTASIRCHLFMSVNNLRSEVRMCGSQSGDQEEIQYRLGIVDAEVNKDTQMTYLLIFQGET